MALQSSGMPFLGGDFSEGSTGTPSLQFSVPCLEIKDEDNKPPSFEYLFYELPLPEFPFKVSFYIANGWCNGKGAHSQMMQILMPDKKTPLIQTPKQPFELKESTTPFMAVNFFQDVEVKEPGVYWVQTYLNERKVLEYPLTVRKAGKG